MAEALALDLDSEKQKENHLSLAGPVMEVKERRSTKAFRTNQIIINLSKDPSETRSSVVFLAARI
ncbi:MAG: hypothetical protein IBX64_00385 [Actinobacteria bacterium]|nr:hypothetical protein [Actinomycetota bacterium]